MDSLPPHYLRPLRTRFPDASTSASASSAELPESPSSGDQSTTNEIGPLPGQVAALSQDRASGLSSPRRRNSPAKRNRIRHTNSSSTCSSGSPLAPQPGLAPGHFAISNSHTRSNSRSQSDINTPMGSTSTMGTTIPAAFPPGFAASAPGFAAPGFVSYGGNSMKSGTGISMTHNGQLSFTPDALLELMDKAKKLGAAESLGGGAPDLFLTLEGKKQRLTSNGGLKKELPKYSNAPPKKSEVDTGLTQRWNWLGVLIFLFYCGAAMYYFVIRASRTLNIGFTWYGWIVLLIEMIASTSTFSYAILLTKHTRSKKSEGLPPADHPRDPNNLDFHLRVLIPCYKEKEDVVRRTVMAAVEAELPNDTMRTVYLCDDGDSVPYRQAKLEEAQREGDAGKIQKAEKKLKDARGFEEKTASREQREMMLMDVCKEKNLRFGVDIVHVKRIKSDSRETNAKSNNLNNCLKEVIYSDYVDLDGLCKDKDELKKAKQIPTSEVIIVLDADMIPEYNFYRKILQPMSDPSMAICLTPQGFYNLPIKEGKKKDIFNSLNLAFWEYMLPGTDAFGYIACTGTNFALRAQPLREVNWFPTESVTEDYALGFNLKINESKGSYLNEYLVYGEAPEEVREIFQQRSRWCKGQMQVLFSKDCPLLQWKLSWRMRLLYTSVTWSYITNTIAVPVNVLVPFIALVFGVYPLVLNRDFALAATLFFTAGAMVSGYCTRVDHMKPMWFTPVSCHLLWFTFTKATINTIVSVIRGNVQEFKSTAKKGQEQQRSGGARDWLKPKNLGDMAGTKDHIIIYCSFAISCITAAVGVFVMIDKPYTAQGDFKWYLALSIFWAIYNMIPPALFIWYIYDNKTGLENFASFCFVLSYIVAVCGIVCTWLVPDDYNLGQVLGVSLQFYEAQRSGKLPRISNTPWRGNSALWDSVLLPNGKNYSLLGGWYDDGGMLKLSYSTAFTVSLLSWAYYEFKGGYVSSNNAEFGANTIRWGADYLLKAAVTNVTSVGGASVSPIFVAQVGDMTRDRLYWGMPERATIPRPASFLSSARPGSDCMAMASAALASAAVAVQGESLQVADNYLQKSIELYRLAQRWRGLYSKFIESGKLYPSVSFYDDLAYAASWIYMATGDETYLADAQAYYDQALAENHVDPNIFRFNYENVVPAVDLLLYQLTGDAKYKGNVQGFVRQWLSRSSSDDAPVFYTPKGLAKAHPSGTLQHTANAAFYVLLAAKQGITGKNYMLHACWARSQMGYMLGDSGRSYVTGYGAQPPEKTPHKAASCAPPDVSDCTFESAYYTTDPNYHTLRGGLVGGPDNDDGWVDDRNMDDPSVTVSLLNSAGFSATMAGLVDGDINMAKCQQGNGFISTLVLKIKGQPETAGQRWWEGM